MNLARNRSGLSLFLCAVLPMTATFYADVPAQAQQPVIPVLGARPPAPSNGERTIALDVVVTDRSGNAIRGLEQEKFTVLDNKQPTKILSFEARDRSTTEQSPETATQIFLLIDELNTAYLRGAYSLSGVKDFLTENQGGLAYPVSVGFLTDTGMQVQTSPSTDGNTMAKAMEDQERGLRSVATAGIGYHVAAERMSRSLTALDAFVEGQRDRPGRKIVIWISPGWPYLGGPDARMTTNESEQVYRSVVLLSAAMRQARIVFYSVDPLGAGSSGQRTTYYRNFSEGLRSPKDAVYGDLGLQVLAVQTGGKVIFGNDPIDRSIRRCAEDAGAYYRVRIAMEPGSKPQEYHSLEVKVGTPGLTARTRTGYYSEP